MTEEQVKTLVSLSPSITEPIDFDGWKAMREEYDYTWENIWDFIVQGVQIPGQYATTRKRDWHATMPELWDFPGFKKNLEGSLEGTEKCCRFCQPPLPLSAFPLRFFIDNLDEEYAFNVYVCSGCHAICREDVWLHPGEIWITTKGEIVATGAASEVIRSKGIFI